MAWNASQTIGTKASIGTAVNTLLASLSIKASTTPTVALTKTGVDTLVAVVVYEHS